MKISIKSISIAFTYPQMQIEKISFYTPGASKKNFDDSQGNCFIDEKVFITKASTGLNKYSVVSDAQLYKNFL